MQMPVLLGVPRIGFHPAGHAWHAQGNLFTADGTDVNLGGVRLELTGSAFPVREGGVKRLVGRVCGWGIVGCGCIP